MYRYRDFSFAVKDNLLQMCLQRDRHPNHDVDKCFPSKLHKMLTEIEQQGLVEIVAWQVHGRSFSIPDDSLIVAFI